MMICTRFVAVVALLGCIATVDTSAQPAAPDLSRPETVVEILIDAAQSGETRLLSHLCHPEIAPERLDPRALQVCGMTADHPSFVPFQGMFAEMRAGGEAEVTANELLTTARVPMVRAGDSTPVGFVNMIEHDGLWYLRGF